MNKIIVVSSDPLHKIPDLSEVFAIELKNILMKLSYNKGNNFDLYVDSGKSMVFYALNMCIEYQQKSNGTIPSNVVDEIWSQVFKAAKREYEVCENDEINTEINKIFYTRIKEPDIISETLKFWEKYKL